MMKNKSTLYTLLNQTETDYEEYKPDNLSAVEKQTLLHIVKGNHPAHNNLKCVPSVKLKPVLLMASCLLLLFLGSQTAFGTRVHGAAESFLQTIQASISAALGNEVSDSDTVLSINEVASLGEAEVKVEELLLFDNKLLINVILDVNQGTDNNKIAQIEELVISINGEEINTNKITGAQMPVTDDDTVTGMLYTLENVEELHLSENMLIDVKILNINVFQLDGFMPEFLPSIEGEAHFSVETSREELTRHTNKYNLESKTVNTERGDYTLLNLYTHPVFSYISVRSWSWDEDFRLMEIHGVNNNGRSVVFTLDEFTTSSYSFENSFIFSESQSDLTTSELAESESLYLQLVFSGYPNTSVDTFEKLGDPFTIELNQ